MTWLIQIDDQDLEGGGVAYNLRDGLTVHDLGAVEITVTAILMGAGLAPQMARTFGRAAREAAKERDEKRVMSWSAPALAHPHRLPDGRTIWVRSLSNPPEDPDKRCDGYTSEGSKCGFNLNHRGDCA